MHVAFNNWGAALASWARTKTPGAAQKLIQEAGGKYKEAVQLKPDYHEAFNNWGSMLLVQAQRHAGVDREDMLDQAEDKIKQAEAIARGAGAYNLACVAAVRREEENCQYWLELARDAGTLPDKTHLEADMDLDAMRETDWFRAFIASL